MRVSARQSSRRGAISFLLRMALRRVDITQDVYLVCLTHALSTEKEEVMGLLFGDTDVRLMGMPMPADIEGLISLAHCL